MKNQNISRVDYAIIDEWDFNTFFDEDDQLRVSLPTFDLGSMSVSDFEEFLEKHSDLPRVAVDEPLIYRSADRGDVVNSREMAKKLVTMGYPLKNREVLWL